MTDKYKRIVGICEKNNFEAKILSSSNSVHINKKSDNGIIRAGITLPHKLRENRYHYSRISYSANLPISFEPDGIAIHEIIEALLDQQSTKYDELLERSFHSTNGMRYHGLGSKNDGAVISMETDGLISTGQSILRVGASADFREQFNGRYVTRNRLETILDNAERFGQNCYDLYPDLVLELFKAYTLSKEGSLHKGTVISFPDARKVL